MIKVVLKIPKGDSKAIAYARHIAMCMEGNPYFPHPPIPIATLLAHVAEAEAAQAATLARTYGAASTRDDKLAILRNELELFRGYVQTLANAVGTSPVVGEAMVVSSGMSIKGKGGGRKRHFYGKQLPNTHSVHLYAPHPGGDASFDWQMSVDGVNWVDAGGTNEADKRIDNLKPGVRYFFRYRCRAKNVLGDWSDPIEIVIV